MGLFATLKRKVRLFVLVGALYVGGTLAIVLGGQPFWAFIESATPTVVSLAILFVVLIAYGSLVRLLFKPTIKLSIVSTIVFGGIYVGVYFLLAKMRIIDAYFSLTLLDAWNVTSLCFVLGVALSIYLIEPRTDRDMRARHLVSVLLEKKEDLNSEER